MAIRSGRTIVLKLTATKLFTGRTRVRSRQDTHVTREVFFLEAVINDYISRELVQDSSLLPLENATSLLETGILDSLSLLRLVVFIQDTFGSTVDDVDLVPENFDSVNTICAYLRSTEGAGQVGSRG